jgi:D-cysteine desulfhydrase
MPPLRTETWLAAAHPALARGVPWRPLAHVPTPVHDCRAIADWLGRDGVWCKRDDAISPVYGGNKVRRYEHLFAEAEARGARALVTAGGFGSTQVLATVMLGRAAGFAVSAALFEQPATSFARRTLLGGIGAGGDLIYGGGYLMTALRTILAYRRAELPYLILPGASNPMANLGYVDAMLELDAQVRAGELPRPDVIVVAAGSSGTTVGLAVGAALLGWPTRVVGVRITDRIACNRATVGALARATARLLAKRAALPAPLRRRDVRIDIEHRAAGGGYGHPTAEAIEAVAQVERLTGSPGEVTYTGKALSVVRQLCAEQPTANVLYWHTLSGTSPPIPDDVLQRVPAPMRPFLEGPVPV